MYGAVVNATTDQSSAIQSALDAAATAASPATVYFPPGKYVLTHTIKVHGNVQRILGFGTYLMPAGATSGVFSSANASSLQPVIQVGGTSDITGSLEIDNLGIYPTSVQGATYYIGMVQSTTKAVTLRSLQISSGSAAQVAYQSTSTGSLFVDDVEGANWLFTTPGQSIFARQFDVEGDTTGVGTSYAAKITNTRLPVVDSGAEDRGRRHAGRVDRRRINGNRRRVLLPGAQPCHDRGQFVRRAELGLLRVLRHLRRIERDRLSE